MTDKKMLMSQTEYAKRIGCTHQAVSKMVKQGRIPPEAIIREGKLKRIDPEIADAALAISTGPESKLSIPKPDPVPDLDGASFAEAKRLEVIGKVKLQALQAADKELELRKKQAELVDAAEVQRAAFECARSVRDRILQVPDRLAAIVTAETDEFRNRELLREELTEALEALSTRNFSDGK